MVKKIIFAGIGVIFAVMLIFYFGNKLFIHTPELPVNGTVEVVTNGYRPNPTIDRFNAYANPSNVRFGIVDSSGDSSRGVQFYGNELQAKYVTVKPSRFSANVWDLPGEPLYLS